MRGLLLIAGLSALLGPLAWALAGDAAQRPHRTELWIYAQAVTALCFGLRWWLRSRAVAAWPRREATVLSAQQTGMYEPGVLAMLVRAEHGTGGLMNQIETKVRVPAAEVGRYAVGAKVTLAVNPDNGREGEFV